MTRLTSLPEPYYADRYCTIYHGDCRDVLPHIEPVDLVLTDPPYGMQLDTDFSKMKNPRTFKGKIQGKDWAPVIGDGAQFDPAPVLSSPDAKQRILFGADYYAARLPKGGSWAVWDKRLTKSGDRMFGSCFELIWFQVPRRRVFYRYRWAGLFGMEKQDTAKRVHPTQKPIDLFKALIADHSDPDALILDPYAGSGTTLLAAKELGRKAIGIEISRAYCDIAIKRLRQEVLF